MRIYVSLQNAWYGKNIEPVLQVLLERGHQIVIGVVEQGEEQAWLDKLASPARKATVASAPRRLDRWAKTADQLRHVIDYLHFLGPSFDRIPYLRLRRRGELPVLAASLIRQHQLRYGMRRRLALWWLKRVDESLPPDPAIVKHLRDHRPDVLVVCPLLGPDTEQHEYVRAAKHLRIPTVYAVHSWDNLSSKGLIRLRPESIAVWNDIQSREAAELHHQPRRRIAVTGAYPFDEWFKTKPSLSRAEFLEQAGLPTDRPFILYLCSALYFAKDQPEVDFVRDWLTRLRASGDEHLRGAAVMIRPHPKRADQFIERNWLGDDKLTAIWPSRGEMPHSPERHQAFFNSLYHADAVVGLNTSAMIEAAIVGRQVHAILHERYQVSQQSTYHFGYLSDQEHGLLRLADCWETHFAQLGEALAGTDGAKRVARFVDAFIRPPDRNRTASALMADEIELTGRGSRVRSLLGLLFFPFTLPWLERMEQRGIAAEIEVAWIRCQALSRWRERREFLASLKRLSPSLMNADATEGKNDNPSGDRRRSRFEPA